MSGRSPWTTVGALEDRGRPRVAKSLDLDAAARRLADAAFGWLARTGESQDFNRKI